MPVVLTWTAIPLVWMGMALVLRESVVGLGDVAHRDNDFHMGLLSLMAVAAQVLLDGGFRLYGHPHYFNATWICYFYFFWRTLSFLGEQPA